MHTRIERIGGGDQLATLVAVGISVDDISPEKSARAAQQSPIGSFI
jgi:hypothetical protein